MSKIAAQHLERKACVYVRQSSIAQVEHHRESTQRQYALRERAVKLGWRVEQVEIVDDDQGQSGASASGRGGFQRLVSEVALGRVGAVLGLEVSRLARSCVDWYRLLEVAALAQTLIVDEDGVYDPNHYNDRLLLGLKGTLSEAELHFLKSRMIGGRRNKARRGAFRIRLPAGYVWEEGEIRLEPDEQVRDAVKLFFACFDRLRSAAAVARYFEEQHQPFPHRDGWGSLSVAPSWAALSVSRAVFHGRHVEPLVEGALLEALSREELELAVAALEKLTERARELDRQWINRLEAARYEAERAARRYHRVEPENRLVARTLEREWNTRLEELERLEQEYAETKRRPPFDLTEEQRNRILALAKDLPRLWHAETTRQSQRKEVLRLLIEDVTVTNVDEPWSIAVGIHWKTGTLSQHQAQRPLPHPQTTAPAVITRIQALYPTNTDAQTAEQLNAEGYRSGYGKPFNAERVAHIRTRRGWKKHIMGLKGQGPFVH